MDDDADNLVPIKFELSGLPTSPTSNPSLREVVDFIAPLGPLEFDFGDADEIERVENFRADYHSFRMGAAFGSKGETSDVVKVPKITRSKEELKEMHRKVERRRTRRINDLINQLKAEVSQNGISVRKDKASILASTLEYIQRLKSQLRETNAKLQREYNRTNSIMEKFNNSPQQQQIRLAAEAFGRQYASKFVKSNSDFKQNEMVSVDHVSYGEEKLGRKRNRGSI